MGTFDPYYNDSYESAAQAAQSAHAAYLFPTVVSTGMASQPSAAAPSASASSPANMSGTASAEMGRMRISTRNLLRGRVTGITPGAVNSIVAVDVGGGNSITAVVTLESLRDLRLAVGSPVVVAINANDVLLLG